MEHIIQNIKKHFKIEYLYLLLLLFVSLPLFNSYLYRLGGGHDINFHLMRIEGLAQGLQMGQFPVKIQPAWYEGYGYGCSVFYGDIFLYLPAILHLLGISLQNSYKVYVFATQAAVIGISAYSFQRIFQNKYISFLGTALYSLAIYRLTNIFVRGAVGEYTAMIFLPLIAYALVLLLHRNSLQKERNKGCLLLALGMTGILQSHILSAEMVCIILAFICVIYFRRVFTKQVFLSFVKAVCLTLFLNLGFLVPFADYMLTGKFNVNAINGGWRVEQNIQDYGAFLSQLAQVFYHAGGGNLERALGTEGEMPLGVGCSLVLAIVFFLFLLFKLTKEEKQSFPWKIAKISCLTAVLSLFMSTCYFPWEVLRKSNVLIRYIVINLQFPWRFCTIASVSLVILWCSLIRITMTRWSLTKAAAAGGAVIVISMITAGYFMADVMHEGQAFQAVFAEDMDTMVESGEEYLPVNTISHDFSEDNLFVEDGITVTELIRSGIRLTIQCRNSTGQDLTMEVPLLYYKGYTAVGRTAEGQKIRLTVTSGTNQVVRVCLPGSFEGVVTVDFKEPVYWRMAEVISVITMLGILILKLKAVINYKL